MHHLSSYYYGKIKSNVSNNIVCIFTIQKKGIQQFEFENPTFFPTNQNRLSRAKFEIVDLETHLTPDFSIGSPTFIEVVVKTQLKRMKTPFQLLLDSSCTESFKRFPSNTNMEFCVQLPKRMEFQKDWMLCLKSIQFCNEFYTLQDCEIKLSGVKQNGNRWTNKAGIRKKFPHNMTKLISVLNQNVSG